MKLLVTLQYEYDVEPERVTNGTTLAEVALLDAEIDPPLIFAEAEKHNLVVTAEEVKS